MIAICMPLLYSLAGEFSRSAADTINTFAAPATTTCDQQPLEQLQLRLGISSTSLSNHFIL